jgi:hypothetical protein
MKVIDNIKSKTGFPVVQRPTPIVDFAQKVGGKGESEQFGEIAAVAGRIGRRIAGAGKKAVHKVGERGRERVTGGHEREGLLGRNRSGFESITFRQRITERASGCSCKCDK